MKFYDFGITLMIVAILGLVGFNML